MSASPPPFVCPRCRGTLRRATHAYACARCAGEYPIVSGIPDFRVFPDPWIGLDDDRAKAERVESISSDLDFEGAVRAYWEMTPDTPRHLAERYVQHVTGAGRRSREWLDTLPRAVAQGPWLDLGCGTGDLTSAAVVRGIPVVGADIAMRWLVIARKRPELHDDRSSLVCCCAEALPFADGSFARVAALGLLEHCSDPMLVLREALRVLAPGGDLMLRTVNRFSLLSEPHVRVWGVGFVPRRLADRYVRWRAGIGYRHHRPLSSRELRRAMRKAGFRGAQVGAARVLNEERAALGRIGASLTPVYSMLRRAPVLRRALSWVAPLLEASATARPR